MDADVAGSRPYKRRRYYGQSTGRPAGVAGSTSHLAVRATRELPLYAPPPTVKVEMKYYDTSDVFIPSTTGNFDDVLAFLTPIAQGTGLSNRIGNRIRILGIQVNLSCRLGNNSVSTGTPGYCGGRFAVVCVRDPTASNISDAGKVYSAPSSSSTLGFQEPTLRDRYKILYHTVFTLCQNTNTARRDWSFNIGCDIPVTFSGTGVTINDVVTNGLCSLFQNTSGAFSGSSNAFIANFRVCYSDA